MKKHTGLAVALLLAGCAADGKDGAPGAEGTAGADGTKGADGTMGEAGPPGPQLAMPGLYTMTNASGGNQIAAYVRAPNGNVSRLGKFSTGGNGGSPGSQGALVFDPGTQRFFAVNNGSDTISMLALGADGRLAELATVASGGKKPVSIAVHAGTVYVANRGDAANSVAGNISGFQIQGETLTAIGDSSRALSSSSDVRPTDITFTPDGKFLVVAELLTDKLDTFEVVNGIAQAGNFQASAGQKPFAFDFSPEGFLIVAEVGSGSASGSTASSYSISTTGVLTARTSALPTLQGAACWIVVAGDFAYMANTATGNITGLNVAEDGTLTLHDANGVTAITSTGTVDLALSPDRGLLYALANGTGSKQIFVFALQPNGNLDAKGQLANVASTAAGLVAR